MNRVYLDTELSKSGGHLSYIEEHYNVFFCVLTNNLRRSSYLKNLWKQLSKYFIMKDSLKILITQMKYIKIAYFLKDVEFL